ncbi:hypothetical protein BDV98DRAFT_577331 [Pterulicium gracile]|uniref:Uncharacterized protein n=1 Tax=Pterulicium gracile TaxID=1884261 RepID=A0A5C3Q0W4_9AGAR|nr:hypothetical protein BDV98DRAFT_577331 [Pterula gracilis]
MYFVSLRASGSSRIYAACTAPMRLLLLAAALFVRSLVCCSIYRVVPTRPGSLS